MLRDKSELLKYVDAGQLTTDYNGFMSYNHKAWLEFMKVFTLLAVASPFEAFPFEFTISETVFDVKRIQTDHL